MERFFGGSPAGVILRLVILSLVVGIVLGVLGLDAFDIVNSLRNLVVRIYNLGFDAFDWLFTYFLLGAVIVFPVWFVARLIKTAGKSRDNPKS